MADEDEDDMEEQGQQEEGEKTTENQQRDTNLLSPTVRNAQLLISCSTQFEILFSSKFINKGLNELPSSVILV